MSYKSIIVNLDIDGPSKPLIKFALEIAIRFKARLIGYTAAESPLPMIAADGVFADGEVWQRIREDIERRQKELHREFDRLVAKSVYAAWIDDVTEPTRLLVMTARMADLIITGSPYGSSSRNLDRSVDLGSLVLQAGRPVLVAAAATERLPLKKAVVAWKDTREARRAVADAVPLLAVAGEVIVVTVDRDPDDWTKSGVADVTAFLGHHGIKAHTEIIKSKDESDRLSEFVKSSGADLLVSGAYGHTRLREFIFGGVTRTVLDDDSVNRFMSS